MKKYLSFFLLLSVFFTIAQEKYLGKKYGTLNEQFEYVMQVSNNFQGYKVVKVDYLLQLKKSSNDSVQKYQINLMDLKKQVTNHKSVITKLNDTLRETQASLKKNQLAQDNVDVFGATIKKNSYNYIMWGTVSTLFLILIVLFFQLKRAKFSAIKSRENLEKIEKDFENYRHKALEKEQKMGRQLQNEINKHKASN